MNNKPENTILVETFDIAAMPRAIKPIGSPTSIETRQCNWYAAHGLIDGKEIRSPLIGVNRDKTKVFIGNTRNLDEFIQMDMTDAKALRLAMDKLIEG